jgi:hypothetical protein
LCARRLNSVVQGLKLRLPGSEFRFQGGAWDLRARDIWPLTSAISISRYLH